MSFRVYPGSAEEMQVVLRRCGLVLGLGLALVPGAPGSVVRATESPIAQMEPRPLASALDAVRDGNWARARSPNFAPANAA